MYLWLFQLLPSSQSHIKEFALLVILARDFIIGNWLPNFGFSILQLPQWDTRFGDRHRYAIIFDTLNLKTMGYITNVMPICMTKFETDALVSTKKLYLNLPICILPSPAPTYIPSWTHWDDFDKSWGTLNNQILDWLETLYPF